MSVCVDGYYIYTDGNRSALLLSPERRLPLSPAGAAGSVEPLCLTFWYYVYGSPAAVTLRAYIGSDQAYSRPEWNRVRPVEGAWTQAELTLHQRSTPLQLIFSAELGNSFSGVALDDISILSGACSGGMSDS